MLLSYTQCTIINRLQYNGQYTTSVILKLLSGTATDWQEIGLDFYRKLMHLWAQAREQLVEQSWGSEG